MTISSLDLFAAAEKAGVEVLWADDGTTIPPREFAGVEDGCVAVHDPIDYDTAHVCGPVALDLTIAAIERGLPDVRYERHHHLGVPSCRGDTHRYWCGAAWATHATRAEALHSLLRVLAKARATDETPDKTPDKTEA